MPLSFGRTFTIALMLFSHIGLPAYLIFDLLRSRAPSKVAHAWQLAHSGILILFIFLIGRWDWAGYYVRYLLLGGYALAGLWSSRHVKDLLLTAGRGWRRWIPSAMRAAESVLAVVALGFVVPAHSPGRQTVRLNFPLQDGTYYIMHGGSNVVLNYHAIDQAQHYAMDIGELNRWEMRASGLYPKSLDRYAIYGEPVHSPCQGQVLKAVDGIRDNIPPHTNPDHIAGNHVFIECSGVKVLLAHMQEDSIQVKPGAQVEVGQTLGLVGNSGNTTEPHLHIHAVPLSATDVLHGSGVPIELAGGFKVRNDLIKS